MNMIRSMGILAGVGAAAVLTGCVAPGPYYGDGGAYPYYADPGPVVVQPNVVLGVDSGPRYWGGRPYYGPDYRPDYRPGGYYPGRPGYYGPRPGYPGRPGVAVPVRPARPVAPAGVPRPIAVPSPAPGAPGGVIQPSWNNRERP